MNIFVRLRTSQYALSCLKRKGVSNFHLRRVRDYSIIVEYTSCIRNFLFPQQKFPCATSYVNVSLQKLFMGNDSLFQSCVGPVVVNTIFYIVIKIIIVI